MQEIFNLSKIKKLVDSEHPEHPQAIIVVDTNIVMDVPDFRQWKTTVNEPIFVVSDMVTQELERIKCRRKQDPKYVKSAEDAIAAINSYSCLLDQGDITEGIYIAEVGWFITIPAPAENAINEALSLFASTVEVFRRADVKFLILTRKLDELMPDNTVVFVTKDYSLFNTAVNNNFPACRFEGFPVTGIEKWIEKKKQEPRDWDALLTDMQRDAEDKSLDVEFTLMSKELVRDMETPMYIHMDIEEIPPTLEKLDYIVAKGCGCVHFSDNPVHFLWNVPYKPFTSETLASDSLRGEPDPVDWSLMIDDPDEFPFGAPGVFDMDTGDLDFLGRDKEEFSLLQWDLVEILGNCVSPDAYINSGMPTLQSPICVAEWFIRKKITHQKQIIPSKYSFQDTVWEAIKFIEISRDYDGLRANLNNLLAQNPDPGNTVADFLDAVTSCWNIGHTVRTRLLYLINDK